MRRRSIASLAILTCTLLLVATLHASILPATQPALAADPDVIHRGQAVRQILLTALEQSCSDNDMWPDRLPNEAAGLLYAKPDPKLIAPTDDSAWDAAAPATAVLWESFANHPAGVWVGYADGHLEFASTPADLESCRSQLEICVPPAPPPATQPAPTSGELTLTILDPQGQPLAGAHVGTFMARGFPTASPLPLFYGHKTDPPFVSDQQGNVTIPADRIFAVKFSEQPSVPIWIYQPQRNLIAKIDVTRADLDARQPRQIQLVPACNLTGQLTNLGLTALGRKMAFTNAIVFNPGHLGMYTLNCMSENQTFNFPLAPGDYGLEAYGTDCQSVYRYFHISPGCAQLNFQIDLPPDRIAELVGQPAPELRNIKGWINGGPTTLADLRGKIVLLDFWGYWCGPCVHEMPALMNLYDKEKDKGLVIIAVHDDSVASVDELKEKMDNIRKEDWPGWKGRNLPFLIALDGGGEMRIKYSSARRRGATTAAYGISSFPTTIAIGRDGKLIGPVDTQFPEGVAAIEKLLNSD